MAATSCFVTPDSPRARKRRLEEVEICLFVTALILVFLLIAGPMRRRHRNFLLGPCTVLLYNLSFPLLLFTLGLMQNAPFCDEMFPLWAAFLVMVQLGGLDAFSTDSLEKNEGWRPFYIQCLCQCAAIGSLMTLDAAKSKSMLSVTICIYVLMLYKVAERIESMESASKSHIQKEYKVIADYMSTEHCNSDSHDIDPVSMRGYKYVVRGEEAKRISDEAEALDYRTPLLVADQELVTVEKVWDCKGWLVSSNGGDPHSHLKDICLSFSLFKFLILKYAGYSMPRQAYQKTWHLIQHGLLSSNDGNGHERVFRVIELELAFLFDLFYTKYPVILRRGHWKGKLLQFVIMLAVSVITAALLFPKYIHVEHQNTVLPMPMQFIITVVVMAIYFVVEILQLWFTYTSEWAQMTWLCNYVKRENWRGEENFEKLLKAVCGVRFFQWDRKLGQYSLVERFSHRPSKIAFNRQTAFFYDRRRNGQKEIDPKMLTEEVKKEVIRSLTMNSSGYLRNGLSSLRRNGVMDQLSWACDLQTQAQVIMVWHIATFFCEHEVPSPRHAQQQRENFNTATTLSKYLAYLVAFAPRLLPDNPYVTQHVFDQVVIEARRFFEGCESLEQRIQKLKYGDPMDKRVVGCAVRLGQQLVNEIIDPESNDDGGFIWRMLAEFWAELALFVAPSDDVEGHLIQLKEGGEFVTHLWALLYHAGIERAAPPPPSSGEDESIEKAAPPPPPLGEDEDEDDA